MENHTDKEILGNSNAAALYKRLREDRQSNNNYFAVGHPSAPNYLEMIGGFSPNWSGRDCVDNAWANPGCKNTVFPPLPLRAWTMPLSRQLQPRMTAMATSKASTRQRPTTVRFAPKSTAD
jgi:hypothetical protein